MSNHISLTVPSDDKKALVAGATMLLTLAGKVPEMELDDAIEEIEAGTTPPPAGDTTPPPAGDTTPPPAGATTPPPAGDTTPPPADVQLDKNGLPWDSRIHAGTKALLADGSWRYKQGVDRATLVLEVEEELRTLMAASVTTAITPPPAAETTPPPADSDAPTTFPEFLKAVSGLIGAGTTTMADVNAVLDNHDVATIQMVGKREDLIPQIWADIVGGNE